MSNKSFQKSFARSFTKSFDISFKNSFEKSLKIFGNKNLLTIIGSQWGDEGKGKIVDTLAPKFDVVARFNGGANAGHTIYANGQKFAFHILPCGVLTPGILNVLGRGVVLDHMSLTAELDALKNALKNSQKIDQNNQKNALKNHQNDPENALKNDQESNFKPNLAISSGAHLLFGFHRKLDEMFEQNLARNKIGTTKKGIGPCYMTKAARLGIRMGDLAYNFDDFVVKYRQALNQIKHQFSFGSDWKYDGEKELEQLFEFRKSHKKSVCDTSLVLDKYLKSGKKVLAEGANATMLDIDCGSYPFVTSSNTTNSGVFNGLGITPKYKFGSIGVVKAYTTRVGEGPFPTELRNQIGEKICEAGGEYGTTTGRKRRVGWLDIPMIRFAARINGFDALNLTKLDVLSCMDEIFIGKTYRIGGKKLPDGAFPSTLNELADVTVDYEKFDGWKCDISKARTIEDLPEAAKRYVKRIEELLQIQIPWVGVGFERNQFALKTD